MFTIEKNHRKQTIINNTNNGKFCSGLLMFETNEILIIDEEQEDLEEYI